MSGGATVELVWIEKQIEHWIRFGRIVRTTIQSRSRSTVAFDPGAVFAFIVSFDEIVSVLFITVRRVETLPKLIWEGIQDNIDPTIAVVATVLVLVTLVLAGAVAVRRT